MEALLIIIVAGLGATVGMSTTMFLLSRLNPGSGDMIVALGSMITKDRKSAFSTGLVFHAVAGVGFAVVYSFLPGMFRVESLAAHLALGGFAGLLHGFAVSFMIVTIVSNQHPLPEFQNASYTVAVTHIIGHVIYGIGVLGLFYALGAALA